jgi:hypothetical protein
LKLFCGVQRLFSTWDFSVTDLSRSLSKRISDRGVPLEAALGGLPPDSIGAQYSVTSTRCNHWAVDPIPERQSGATMGLETPFLPRSAAFGRRVVDVKQDGNVVQMSFADGSEAEASVVIGADGVNSKLRQAVVGPSQSRFSGAVAHRAIYPSTLLGGMQVRNCTKWWGPNSHILIYYIEQSPDEIYLVTSAKGEWHSQASWEFCPQEEVINAFAGFTRKSAR